MARRAYKNNMNKNFIIGAVIALVIVGGASFYGGMTYANNQTPARGSFAGGQFSGTSTGASRMGGRAGSGFTSGKIISTGNGSITVQVQSGSTQIVLVGGSTSILKSVSGALSDLTVGTNIIVAGTSNSDGSLSASSIQIRPAGAPSQTGAPNQPSSGGN